MKKPVLIFWILIGVFFIFFWVYLPPFSRYRDLKIKQEEIERQIRDLEVNIKTIKEERDLLKGDLAYLEKVIRDELGLVRPGEIVYKFVEEPQKEERAQGRAPVSAPSSARTPDSAKPAAEGSGNFSGTQTPASTVPSSSPSPSSH